MKLTIDQSDIVRLVRDFVLTLDPKQRNVLMSFEQMIGNEWIEVSGPMRIVVDLLIKEDNAKTK